MQFGTDNENEFEGSYDNELRIHTSHVYVRASIHATLSVNKAADVPSIDHFSAGAPVPQFTTAAPSPSPPSPLRQRRAPAAA